FSHFFYHNTATTDLYTLSLHDALPICIMVLSWWQKNPNRKTTKSRETRARFRRRTSWRPQFEFLEDRFMPALVTWTGIDANFNLDRKSTRLNSSHDQISYAVFCLKKKK